jgi:peptide/nickel transport system substrate-binding protein
MLDLSVWRGTRRRLLLLASGIAVAAAINIGAGSLSPAWAEGTFRLAIAEDALTLDPIASSDNASIWTELLIFDQLVRPSKDGTKLEPGLAESWTIAPDGLEYVFTLRDAKFANGEPVTAEDVVYSLQRAAGETSDWARFFKPITSYEIVDPKTIRMRLDKPFTPMLNNLALFSGSIVPKEEVEAKGDEFFQQPFGSGPFQVKEWSRGEKITLTKNPHYWQDGKPAVDEAVIEIVNDDNARVLKLKAGEVDAIIGVPFNQVSQLKADAALKVNVASVFRTEMVQLNTKKKPFDDQRVRQALNYAVDKDALIQGVLRGNGTPAVSSLPVMAYHNTDLTPYPLDLEKAKSLLAEAGYADGFKASLLVPSGDVTYRQVATALQSDLRKIGVEIELQSIEGSSQYSTTKAGNFEMSLSYCSSDTIDPDQLIGFTAINPERANAFHTEWKDDRVNALYEEERRTADGPERAAQFKEMEARVHDGAPFIFLYHQGIPYASRSNVEGFEILATSNYRLEDVVLKP